MEHPGEIWQEYDFNGERLGGIEPTDHIGDDIKLYGAVAIMLYRFNNGKVEFLFQHRSKNLRSNPDTWDVSAGGHINLNEPRIVSAVRETKEEIGINIDAKNLEFAITYIRFKIFNTLFFYDYTDCDDDFSFDDEEVSEVKWVSEDELEDFWPSLKRHLDEDVIFSNFIKEQIEKTKLKYGNN